MHKIKLSFLSTLSLVVLTLGSAGVVFATTAAEQSAEQTQTVKVTCTSGAYGQDSSCTSEGTQSQKLHQVITYASVLGSSKVHTPVDTAVDPSMMLAFFATGLTGIGAFIGYTRLS